ncbi:HAMP domain-containing histidine kinase [Candidatus Daviesbacteria bacterium]|nr:HAMP domain-containing histidine kinase [Candidatus Daviesbacteria bacterium]
MEYMQGTNNQTFNQEKLKLPGEVNIEILVHVIRILLKTAVVAFLYYSGARYFLPLSVYIIISEVLDQFSVYISKGKPRYQAFVKVFYVINSVAVITTVAFFANWVTDDFYLFYLIHISSAMLMYGYKIGLFSFVLSVSLYSGLLFMNNAPPAIYLRLPLLSLLFFRLFINQYRFGKTEKFLNNVLGIEKAKQDFIALASHNLRTPVSAVYGYIDLLLRGDPGPLNELQTGYIKKIKMNNQELERTTESLLQISIFEIGKGVNLFKQPSQIELVIEDTVEKFTQAAKIKGLELIFEKETGFLPLVDIDVQKITAVLSNLMDNAIKYTKKGVIVVNATKQEDFIKVSVKDTGVGIPPEDLPKIFNKFFRSGNVLVYNQTGAGLGLYLGKQIIELHGGRMSIDSIIERGTTVTFSLPVAKKEDF